MKPTIIDDYGVRACCPDCNGAVCTFDFKDASGEFGYILIEGTHNFDGNTYGRVHYRLLRCSGCRRAGLAKFHDTGDSPIALEWFHPRAYATSALPSEVPDGIVNEYREAEVCASAEAWRAASAMLRSTLEKTLKANGYTKGKLYQKIEAAAADGVITAARKKRAHDNIRVLGNDVVHDEWRAVDEEEVQAALHYAQRILEDLYDDRATVEKLLIEKDRIEAATSDDKEEPNPTQ